MVDRLDGKFIRSMAARVGLVGTMLFTGCSNGSPEQNQTPVQTLGPGSEVVVGPHPTTVPDILNKEAVNRHREAIRREILSTRPLSPSYLKSFKDSWVSGEREVTEIITTNGGRLSVIFYHSSQRPLEADTIATTTYSSLSGYSKLGKLRFIGVQGHLDLAAASIFGPEIVEMFRTGQALQTERHLRGIATVLGEAGVNFVDAIEPQLKAKGIDEAVLNQLLNERDRYISFNAWLVAEAHNTITLRELVDRYPDGSILFVYVTAPGSQDKVRVPLIKGQIYDDGGNFATGITSLGRGLQGYRNFFDLTGAITSFEQLQDWPVYLQRMEDRFNRGIRNPGII